MKTLALVALTFAATALSADVQPEEDSTIESPRILGVRVYVDDPHPVLSFQWDHIPGVVAYQIWREVWITQRLDNDGALVTLGEPTAEFIPWKRIDLGHDDPVNDQPADAKVTISAPVHPRDDVLSRWALSAEVERDGALYRSPLHIYDLTALPLRSPTAVSVKSWGRVKSDF